MKPIRTIWILILITSFLMACSGQNLPSPETRSLSPIATQTTVEASEENSENTYLQSAPPASMEDFMSGRDTHENANEMTWNTAEEVRITLEGRTIYAESSAVSVTGSQVLITQPGTYRFQGTLEDGQILVRSTSEGIVRLILDNVNLSSSSGSPLVIEEADEAHIVLAEGATNTLTDAKTYTFDNPEEEEPNATLFSKANLSIYGNGILKVQGNAYDGIVSKDGLVISSATLSVEAIDEGIRGKDYVIFRDAYITVLAGGDGIQSDNEKEAKQGYILIENTTLNVQATGDALSAQTDIGIVSGTFNLVSGGGSTALLAENTSAKGIKGASSLLIEGGEFVLDTADDALHSNGVIIIHGGTFTLSSGDDALHADSAIQIFNGEFQIHRSYEGIESAQITISGGTLHIAASDDGINVGGGQDASGFMPAGMRQRPGGGQQVMPPANAPGQDTFSTNSDYWFSMEGGYVALNTDGDGIDINGTIRMSAGTLIIHGPTEQMNGALDFDAGFSMSGGTLIAAGSAGMAMAPSTNSTQPSVLIYFSEIQPGGTLITIRDSRNNLLLTFAPEKPIQTLVFSSPQLQSGETYEVLVGGVSSGSVYDGVIQSGTYTPGNSYASFNLSNTVTLVGNRSAGGMRP